MTFAWRGRVYDYDFDIQDSNRDEWIIDQDNQQPSINIIKSKNQVGKDHGMGSFIQVHFRNFNKED